MLSLTESLAFPVLPSLQDEKMALLKPLLLLALVLSTAFASARLIWTNWPAAVQLLCKLD